MNTHKPIVLQQNNRYPSYQLYAIAGNATADPDAVLKRCVLHVFDWLRARFSSFEIPQLNVPAPAQANDFPLEELVSFRLTEPYSLEVISLPEDRVWSMLLTEPDPGVKESFSSEARVPVAGRIFETNIAFRVTEKGVECGFRTMVSEPHGEAEAECFRPACVKAIARDPSIGLYHGGYKLQDEPITIDDVSHAKKLMRWIEAPTRQMAVIVIDNAAEESNLAMPPEMPDFEEIRASLQKPGLRSRIDLLYEKTCGADNQNVKADIDGLRLARYRMGYVQFFVLDPSVSAFFVKAADAKPGSRVTIYEPAAFGGNVQRVPAGTDTPVAEQMVDELASNYPSKKYIDFGGVLFLDGAKELQNSHIAALAQSREALVSAYKDKIRAIEDSHRDALAASRAQTDALARENNRLQKELEKQNMQIAAMRQRLDVLELREQMRAADTAAQDDFELARYRAKERRPRKLADAVEWVRQEFENRLILHDRAEGNLTSEKFAEKNMPRLCDAIEYLAIDYRDYLLGLIDEDELNRNCAAKYGRGFEVVPTGYDRSNAAGTPKEYKIKYYEGFNGKKVESVLDLHLRVGNTSSELIRIYFLYDKTNKLIVVGSLPKHLPTQSCPH